MSTVKFRLLQRRAASSPTALRLPDFLIIGAAKSATTTLFSHLQLHSQVHPCREKEPMFFAADDVYKRGIEWYAELFHEAPPDKLTFEASTGYTRWPQVPDAAERIARHLPHAKLIYIMRHPVDRAYSQYVHRYTRELHPGEPIRQTFEEFIEEEPMCLDSSLYMRQIERYLPLFPRESMLFLLTDDFEADRRAVLEHVTRFLGIGDESSRMVSASRERENDSSRQKRWMMRRRILEPVKAIPFVARCASLVPRPWREGAYEFLRRSPYGRRRVAGLEPKPMLPQTRARLLTDFDEPNRELAAFLGRDLSTWSR